MDGASLQVNRAAFAQNLAYGQVGESRIARWLRGRGWHVLPVYEKEIDNGKGPRLFMASDCGKGQLIAPDMLAMKDGIFKWIEAKHKTHFTWYGKGKRFETGIDLRHFRDYCEVQDSTSIPVWVMFLHTDCHTWEPDIKKWGAPPLCPVGLFGDTIAALRETGRESADYGPSGMVYWAHSQLKELAKLGDV